MLGFSLTKLLFTALVVFAVWYAFSRVRRLGGSGSRRRPSTSGPTSAPAAVEDMVRCAVCGEFTAASGPRECPREECPHRA
ncbi:MAG: hypothetical protein QF738_06585 [Rhodospirillales bacterium]|jgi:hypothetical protein|nr:hypothetical protein [Rhodospirillales bacterium]